MPFRSVASGCVVVLHDISFSMFKAAFYCVRESKVCVMNSSLLYVSIVRVGCSFVIKRNPRVVDVLDDFRGLSKLMNSFVPQIAKDIKGLFKNKDNASTPSNLLTLSLAILGEFVDIVDYTSEGLYT